MKTARCAYLFGMGSKPRQWERPLLFFAALFAADLVFLVIEPVFQNIREAHNLRQWGFAPPEVWLSVMAENLLLAILSAVAFRLIRNVFALVPLAIAYGVACIALAYVLAIGLPPGDPRFLAYLIIKVLWAVGLISLLELAMRFFKGLLPGLVTAAVANSLMLLGLGALTRKLVAGETVSFSARLSLLPFDLLHAVVLALILYAALRLTSGGAPLDQTPVPARISKGFYLGTFATANAISTLLSFAVIVFVLTGIWNVREEHQLIGAFLVIGVAGVLVTYAAVVFSVLIYKMWAALPIAWARTTPGRAVGLLFVPIYNLFWVFQVFRGFATDYNVFAERHALPGPRLSTGLFTAYPVLCLLAAIPYLGLLLVPAAYVVGLVMIAQICDAVNAAPAHVPAPPPTYSETSL